MEKQDLKNKPSEKLQSQLKTTKLITDILIGALSFLVGICIYGLFTSDNKTTFISLLVVAFSIGIIIPINYMNMAIIKKELESRD